MKILAALMFASLGVHAACPDGWLEQERVGQPPLCIAPDVICDFPLVRVCTTSGPQVCRCDSQIFQAAPVLACQINVVYDPRDPSAAYSIEPPTNRCDAAGTDLALAAILAKRLGFKPTP